MKVSLVVLSFLFVIASCQVNERKLRTRRQKLVKIDDISKQLIVEEELAENEDTLLAMQMSMSMAMGGGQR